MATIDGPGRSRHGLEGNQSVAVADRVACRTAGYWPSTWNTAHAPAGTSMASSRLAQASLGDRDAVEVGQLAALRVVRVDVGAHLQQTYGLGVAQLLESGVLCRRQRRDVGLDVGLTP